MTTKTPCITPSAAMTEKHQCAGNTRPSGAWYRPSRCPRNGTLEHDGKWWCKQHHPPSVKERDEVKHAGWDADWAASDKARMEAKAAQAELERRSRAYDAVMEWALRPNAGNASGHVVVILETTK